ncbi:MAG TPA: 50S ribosomal protein L18 [archaeon]|nr:50S ribosomal protein L18 [archaeon]
MKPRLRLKRRLEGVTDYKARLALLKSGKFRLVVRKTYNNLIMQVVNYLPEGDEVLVTADLVELRRKFGWQAGANVSSAYLVGYILGKKAVKHKLPEAIVDLGLHPATKGGRVFAAVKGAVDAGFNVACNPDMFPSEERIKGKHIVAHANQAPKPTFAKYGIKPAELENHFNQVLNKVKEA